MKRDIIYFMNEIIVDCKFIDIASIEWMLESGKVYNAVICLALLVGEIEDVHKKC